MNEKIKLRWRRYMVCLLPIAGLLIVLFYLSVFSIYRGWLIGPAKREPTDVSFIFEALSSLRGNLGVNEETSMLDAISLKNVVVWGYATGLVATSLLIGILLTGYVIWNGPRNLEDRKRWIMTACMMALAIVPGLLIGDVLGGFDRFTVIPRQFWGGISSQLTFTCGWLNLMNIEKFIVAMGYGMPWALAFASSATLLPVRELEEPSTRLNKEKVERAAQYVSMQMKHLRLVLYVGAILLVVIMFRHRATLSWMLEYLKPVPTLKDKPGYENANLLYGHLEALVSSIVMATSVMNTLLLAALYVPSALVLHRRAVELSRYAVAFEKGRPVTALDAAKTKGQAQKEETKDENGVGDNDFKEEKQKQEEWMKSRGLTHPFKEQLPKVAAILSPLLAGPIGELLNLFR